MLDRMTSDFQKSISVEVFSDRGSPARGTASGSVVIVGHGTVGGKWDPLTKMVLPRDSTSDLISS